VTCNSGLRQALSGECAAAGMELRLAAPAFCTDNAGMVGILAARKLHQGCEPSGLDEEPLPGWELADGVGIP
jgi:tRNA A37 threonylcarbamoyltransferase TsaD